MIYTKLTKKAMVLAYNAHKDQFDRSDIPYIYHPIHLAEQMDNEYECMVALLHDVVEDTNITFDYLSEIFPKEVIDALKLLTHNENVPYMDYVKNIKNNDIARKVKIADLKHNSTLERLDEVKENDIKRKEKYSEALKYLEE